MSSTNRPRRIRAVTFDAGGTLLRPWPSVGAVYSEAIRQLGLVEPDPKVLNARFEAAWSERGAFDYSRSSWGVLVERVLAGCVLPADLSRVFDRLWIRFTEADAWNVYPDVVPCLSTLHRQGMRMAVVSNWDERLRPVLNAVGLADWFEFVLASVEGPGPKPDPRLFQVAAARLGLPPDSILHVGDSWREDAAGARSAGFQARWLCRADGNGGARGADSIGSLNDLFALAGSC